MSAVSLLNPETMAKPLGAYSHAVLCQGAGRWLHVAGQIGVSSNGDLPEDIEAQAENVWSNIVKVLESAGMAPTDLVKITTYVTAASHLAIAGAVRARYLQDHRPASTVLVVQALAAPEWLVEVDAVAFRGAA